MNKKINIVYVSVEALKSAVYNPRKHSPDQMTQLKESIQRFGLVDPIIVNSAPGREQVVIGGHFRLEAVKELGIVSIPVVYVDISDIQMEKELNIRLNKNTGEWDYEKLKVFEADYLVDIGFDAVELSNAWDNEIDVEDENFDEEKELENIRDAQTKPGDLILLGKHRLLCGDSTNPKTLERLFGDDRASMIYSDPPYNIQLDYNKGVGGKKNYGGAVKDDRSDLAYKEFIRNTMQSALSVSNTDVHVFYWSDQKYIWLMQTLYQELGVANKRVCLWIKNGHNPTPTVAFNKCYEPCTYGTRGSPYLSLKKMKFNEVLNSDVTGGNDMLDEISDIWGVRRLSGNEYEHATSKPVALHSKAILRCTKPNDIILDSFSGSGSTLIAGERLKRRVYAVEQEPVFCDLVIRRWQKLTGCTAQVIKYEKTQKI